MHCEQIDVVLQEVPGEISLSFSITGCPLRCPGCHSPFLRKAERGRELPVTDYLDYLDTYRELASCVLFMGGEWEEATLSRYLDLARERGYRTCLYTGQDAISAELSERLDYLKTGPWKQELGGLDSPHTNQRFVRLADGEILNHLFHYS